MSKGWVTLAGEVEWQFQKLDAERVVRRLTGVKGVSNLITVKPSVTPADMKKKSRKRWSGPPERREPITVEVDGPR